MPVFTKTKRSIESGRGGGGHEGGCGVVTVQRLIYIYIYTFFV